MASTRNKRVRKLREYRDRLIESNTNMEGAMREYQHVFSEIRKALGKEDTLRAYALASSQSADDEEFPLINEMAKELALVYRFLITEREYTKTIGIAANQRDYLRVAALVAEHNQHVRAREATLTEWQKIHGFSKSLRDRDRKEGRDEQEY